MNEIIRLPMTRPTTQAADGIPRLQWSLAEFERLCELGVLTEADRIELIGGELVPMSPKGIRHEIVRDGIMNWLVRHLPANVRLASEIGWRPGGTGYLEPDFLLYPSGHTAVGVAPAEVLLVIEVASSSLAYDTGVKARTYAALGVREYWVIDASTLATHVFRDPAGEGYGSVSVAPPDQAIAAIFVQPLALRLDALDIADA